LRRIPEKVSFLICVDLVAYKGFVSQIPWQRPWLKRLAFLPNPKKLSLFANLRYKHIADMFA